MNGTEDGTGLALRRFFVADPDTARRVLATHIPHRHGWCEGCGDIRHTPWPCVIVVAAEHALTQLGLIPHQRGHHA